MSTLTAGIDLSTDAGRTGVAMVEWTGAGGSVVEILHGLSDGDLCDVIKNAGKTGIDCPLGWPQGFVDLVTAHHGPGGYRNVLGSARPLLRAGDLRVRELVPGAQPISVAANLLGSTAMMCADLQGKLAEHGMRVDRTGATGKVVEVYPAAALRLWGVTHSRYKGRDKTAERATLISELSQVAPWLSLGSHTDACLASDDALDAVICTVIARLQEVGLCEPIPDESRELASVEGWIAIPRPDALAKISAGAVDA